MKSRADAPSRHWCSRAPRAAAEIEVKMLDKGTEGVMVFEPALVKIEPGDTVKFVATNKGHNAEIHQGHAAGRRHAVRRQGEPGHRGHLRQARRLRREVPAALRHGHGRADRGRNAGQCRTRPGPSRIPARPSRCSPRCSASCPRKPPRSSEEYAMAPIPRLKPYAGRRCSPTASAPSSCSARFMPARDPRLAAASLPASSRCRPRSRRATGTCTRCSMATCRRW